jgi:hypothetical protein
MWVLVKGSQAAKSTAIADCRVMGLLSVVEHRPFQQKAAGCHTSVSPALLCGKFVLVS